MSKRNNRNSDAYSKDWAAAKKRCRLNMDDIRMAKELGLTPRRLMRNVPSPRQQWKLPVRLWIRELYSKRFHGGGIGIDSLRPAENAIVDHPFGCEPIEEAPQPAGSTDAYADADTDVDADANEEDADLTEDADADAESEAEADSQAHPWLGVRSHEELDEMARMEGWDDDECVDRFQEFNSWEARQPLRSSEIRQDDQAMLRRHRHFRTTAEYVAREFAKHPTVRKVVLFGSVAMPLHKEVPRFRKYRRERIEIWHECSDVDLAVWTTDFSQLNSLRKALNRALDDLAREHGITTANHQVDVFLMDDMTGRYAGRLCHFNQCPKQKRECEVPGCGTSQFLQLHEDFEFDYGGLTPERSVVLFEREPQAGGPSRTEDC